MEFVYEFLFEIYLELMMLIVPEEKVTSKKYKVKNISTKCVNTLFKTFKLNNTL